MELTESLFRQTKTYHVAGIAIGVHHSLCILQWKRYE